MELNNNSLLKKKIILHILQKKKLSTSVLLNIFKINDILAMTMNLKSKSKYKAGK